MKNKVSIALCTFNGSRFLSEQLDSIVNQTVVPFEVIVVDDNSVDDTRKVLEEYAERYECIKLYFNQNTLGYSKNFEKAISLCNGDLIALSDQDDIWHPRKIEILTDKIGEDLLVYHDSAFVDWKGESIEGMRSSTKFGVYKGRGNLEFLRSNMISGHSVLFKKEVVDMILPLPGNIPHDWWIAFIAASFGTISYVDQVLVKYRQHGGNVTDPIGASGKPAVETPVFNKAWINLLSTTAVPNSQMIREIIAKIYKLNSYSSKDLRRLYFMLRHQNYFLCSKGRQRPFLSKINRIFKLYLKHVNLINY